MPPKRKDPPSSAESTSIVLSSTGDEMPLVGLGTWKSSPDAVKAAVTSAIKAGYRHIDCAHCYNNENAVGEALAEMFHEGVVKRDDLFICSKLWNTKHGEKQVVGAVKHTLTQLKLKRLDLYLIHWPHAFQSAEGHHENFPKRADGTGPIYDNDLHFCETWRGMEEAVKLGLVRNIGVSNFNSKQLDELMSTCKIPPCINQGNALHEIKREA